MEIANIKNYFFLNFVQHLIIRGGQVVAVLRVVNSLPCVQRGTACVSNMRPTIFVQLIHQYVIIPRRFTDTTPKIIININITPVH